MHILLSLPPDSGFVPVLREELPCAAGQLVAARRVEVREVGRVPPLADLPHSVDILRARVHLELSVIRLRLVPLHQ